jgi:hypothetical protein
VWEKKMDDLDWKADLVGMVDRVRKEKAERLDGAFDGYTIKVYKVGAQIRIDLTFSE